MWRAQTGRAQRYLRQDRMVDRKCDLDLVRADAWILGGALGLGLRAKLGPVAAQGAVQLRPSLPQNGGPGWPGYYPHAVCVCEGWPIRVNDMLAGLSGWGMSFACMCLTLTLTET